MQLKDLLDLQANARQRSAAAVEALQAEVMAARATRESRQSMASRTEDADGLVAALDAERDRRQKAEKHFDELLHAHLCIAAHDQVIFVIKLT